MRGMAVSAAAASLLFGSVTAAHAAPLPATTPVSDISVDETVPTPAPKTSLAIKKIASPVAPVKGTATVKPAVSTAGWVTVTSKFVTVKQGNKTVAKNTTKAKLKAGTYSVKTTVKYKTYAMEDGKQVYSASKSTSKTQKLVVRNAVAVKSITGKKVPYNGKATIKPNVSAAKGVKVVAKTLTVKLGDKTVAKNKKSASLRAGKYKVTTTVKYRLPSSASTRSAMKTQWLTIKSGKKPSRVAGTGSWNCPAGYPIKGNASSMIYHVPGGGFYNRTNPEECFASGSTYRRHGTAHFSPGWPSSLHRRETRLAPRRSVPGKPMRAQTAQPMPRGEASTTLSRSSVTSATAWTTVLTAFCVSSPPLTYGAESSAFGCCQTQTARITRPDCRRWSRQSPAGRNRTASPGRRRT